MARNRNASDPAFAARVQRFTQWFTRAIIDYQQREGVWVTSGTEIARLIKVAPSTVLAWTKSKSLPQRDQCLKVAETLHIPVAEVLEAAGYSLKEGIPLTYEELLARLAENSVFADARESAYVSERIQAITHDDFAASSYKPVADLLLGHVATPIPVRAHQLAALVDAWRISCQREVYQHAG